MPTSLLLLWALLPLEERVLFGLIGVAMLYGTVLLVFHAARYAWDNLPQDEEEEESALPASPKPRKRRSK